MSVKTVILYERSSDQKIKEQLEVQLQALVRQGIITIWSEGQMLPGKLWRQEYIQACSQAQLFLVLITSEFLASSFHQQYFQGAIHQYRQGKAELVLIVVDYCLWEDYIDLPILPKNRKPISAWKNKGEAMLQIVNGVKQLIARMPGKYIE